MCTLTTRALPAGITKGVRPIALVILCAGVLLTGCGDDPEPAAADGRACGAAASEQAAGPFCFTQEAALRDVDLDATCREARSEGEGRPWPLSVHRCRAGGARFTLAVYPSHNDALRARPRFLAERGLSVPSHRVELSHNLLVVVDRQSAAGTRVLKAFDELGDRVT